MHWFRRLIHEAHRRSLWQVLGIYAVVSWVVLQVVDVVADNMGLPEWTFPFAVVLLLLGLPVVLATAFVQEGIGSPDPDAAPVDVGHPVERRASGSGDDAADRSVTTGQRLLTWRNFGIGAGAAILLWMGIALGWLAFADRAPLDAAAVTRGIDRSIAVLPFATRSSNEDDRFFSEGMHDDLLTQLARIDSLTVISRTSVKQYENTTRSIPEIAQELGVATVLEGAVQRAGDRIRLNVQLIEAETDAHLWAETYDEELTAENVFAIQTSLATEIANALRATFASSPSARGATESLAAYELVAKGRSMLTTRASRGENLAETRRYFEQAIELDSTYAAAWAGLGTMWLSAVNWARVPAAEGTTHARAATDRALALDPQNVDARLNEVSILENLGRAEDALDAVRDVLEANPGNVLANFRLAALLEAQGDHEESIRVARRVVELDPRVAANHTMLADRLYFAGQFEESIAVSQHATSLDPGDWYNWYNTGWAQAAAGRPAESIEAFREALALASDSRASVMDGMAYAWALAGAEDSARTALAAGTPTTYDAALALFTLGDTIAAFASLEASLAAEPSIAARLLLDPAAAVMLRNARMKRLVDAALDR